MQLAGGSRAFNDDRDSVKTAKSVRESKFSLNLGKFIQILFQKRPLVVWNGSKRFRF